MSIYPIVMAEYLIQFCFILIVIIYYRMTHFITQLPYRITGILPDNKRLTTKYFSYFIECVTKMGKNDENHLKIHVLN